GWWAATVFCGRTAWWPTGSTWGTGSSSSRGRWWGPTDLATPPTERERTTKSPIWAPWWWRMMWRSAPTVPLTGGPWGRRSSGGGPRSEERRVGKEGRAGGG